MLKKILFFLLFCTSVYAGPQKHLEDRLFLTLKAEFPNGTLAELLYKNFGDEMKSVGIGNTVLYFEWQVNALEQNELTPSSCRDYMTYAHWLAHVYEYKEQWQNAFVTLNRVAHSDCLNFPRDAQDLYGLDIDGHLRLKHE